MIEVQDAVVLNIVIILCIAAMGGLFNGTGMGRRFSALWFGWGAFSLSLAGWIIYVAVHFISKYW